MSTFFDKLSGAKPQAHEINLSTSNNVHASKPQEQAKVEAPAIKEALAPLETNTHTTAEVVSEQSQKDEPMAEEEGELTVDIYNKGDAIFIQSTVAGVKPEHLDVAITDDMVTIRGRRERADLVKEEHYYYKELFWGTFSRQVILPEEIEQEDAEANLQHGLLTIKLPKKRHGITQKLKVKVV